MEMGDMMKQVFGDSSEEEEEAICPKWEKVPNIKGLWIFKHFLSSHQQSSLLTSIHKEGWFTQHSHNQAMRFGDLPPWGIELSNSIHQALCLSDFFPESQHPETRYADKDVSSLPSEFLWRDPLFDQLIVNVYQPTEGICAHVDLMRFEDGIAIVSLESCCVMHFSKIESQKVDEAFESKIPVNPNKIPVYLMPGSLVLMCGEARYLWMHEINRKSGVQIWDDGQEIHQNKRTSITLRKLCNTQ